MNFVTGRGILDPGRLRARRKRLVDAGETSAEPDPRPAVLAFDAACRAAGARLVVVPVPDKAMLMPRAAGFPAGRGPAPAVVANVDYPRFLAGLREAGVDVYDPTPPDAAPDDPPRFLEQDTHWTPEWMEAVARGVADHVRAAVALPPGGAARYRTEEVAVRRAGDLVDMLELPPGQTLFPPREVTVRRTVDPATGAPPEPDPSADVLLLGDSFANIYTAPQMGWGDGAGFAPALARHLGRKLDVIAVNGAGASGTRRELARRPEGLSGKRVVVWEFAVRELTDGSWDVIPVSAAPAARPATPAGTPLVIEATIEAVSKVPEPYSVPYPDCLTYTLWRVDRVVEGDYADGQILAVMWAMKNNAALPPAKYAPGRRLRAKLIPLRQADERVRTGQRADDTGDYTHRPYFVLEEHGL
jgi:alginate O-acetyltransferase complex protein AlgJ